LRTSGYDVLVSAERPPAARGPEPPPGIPAPGDVFAGKYRIERVLGVGGMGVVLAAHHLALDERVAIKLMLPALAGESTTSLRFLREARATVKIRSEHVARILDVATLDNGHPYIVMEHLEGADLASLLHKHGRLPITEAVDYVLQACEAIAHAHAVGIVHRDVKPSNLFVVESPDGTKCLKVLDFGISKAVDPSDALHGMDVTKTQAVVGSPMYMAPEQMRTKRTADRRSDIWSLGVVLYEALGGSPPFDANTMPELCALILQDAPPPLRRARPETPPPLEAAVLQCLEKDPEKRFPDVAHFAAAIAPFGSPGAQEGVARLARLRFDRSASTPSPAITAESAMPAPDRAKTAATWTAAPWATTGRQRAVYLLAAGVLVGVLALSLAVLLRARRGHGPSASSAAMVAASPAPPPPASSLAPPTWTPETAAAPPSSATVAAVSSSSLTKKPSPSRPPARRPATSPHTVPTSAPADSGGRASSRFE
jgi:serine/threonine protein kinase